MPPEAVDTPFGFAGCCGFLLGFGRTSGSAGFGRRMNGGGPPFGVRPVGGAEGGPEGGPDGGPEGDALMAISKAGEVAVCRASSTAAPLRAGRREKPLAFSEMVL